MIKVTYGVKEDHYFSLYVTGHAGSGKYGKDLVCAGVSCIMYGLANALDQLKEDVKISFEDNMIDIVNNSNSKIVDDYLELAIIQLKTIEESYKDNLQVERKQLWNLF